MMRTRVMLAVALVGLTGCATTFWYGSPSNVKSTTLSLGMSKQQAAAMLGSPRDIVTQEIDGMMVETWKYMDRTLTFHNGILQSWGTDLGDAGNKP